MTVQTAIAELSPYILPEGSRAARDMPRPPELRQPGYTERFDFRTLFYDAFHYKNLIMLIGPPLFNFRIPLQRGKFWLDDKPLADDAFALRDLNNMSRTTAVASSPHHAKIQFRAAAPYENDVYGAIKIQKNQSRIFNGKRVLLVLSKNNPLRWIRDLISFYVKFHGIDAVLLYDNASDAYSNEELLAAVASVEGIRAAVVVPYNVPWGPPAGASGKWDSNFAQYAALEHARFRFLSTCAGVIYTDVDELVVPHRNITLFDAMRIAKYPAITYGSYTFLMVNAEEKKELHYRDFKYYYDPAMPPPVLSDVTLNTIMRWTAIPEYIPFDVQFSVHTFSGYQMLNVSDWFRIRHFLPMTALGDKKGRLKSVPYDKNVHRLDVDLLRAMKVIGWS